MEAYQHILCTKDFVGATFLCDNADRIFTVWCIFFRIALDLNVFDSISISNFVTTVAAYVVQQ